MRTISYLLLIIVILKVLLPLSNQQIACPGDQSFCNGGCSDDCGDDPNGPIGLQTETVSLQIACPGDQSFCNGGCSDDCGDDPNGPIGLQTEAVSLQIACPGDQSFCNGGCSDDCGDDPNGPIGLFLAEIDCGAGQLNCGGQCQSVMIPCSDPIPGPAQPTQCAAGTYLCGQICIGPDETCNDPNPQPTPNTCEEGFDLCDGQCQSVMIPCDQNSSNIVAGFLSKFK